jgi:hypothetical protein
MGGDGPNSFQEWLPREFGGIDRRKIPGDEAHHASSGNGVKN